MKNKLISKIRNYMYFRKKCHVFCGVTNHNRVLYFGGALHNNLGDMAQKYCIRKWINQNFPGHIVLEIPTRIIVDERFDFLKTLKNNVSLDDIIVFQSGYNTHDILGGTENEMHKIIVSMFPENKILMLPQTVNFENKCNMDSTGAILDNAVNMLFLARDEISYENAKIMMNKPRVVLFPDIVTTLIGKYSFCNKRSGVLLCLRNDTEQYYSADETTNLRNRLSQRMKVEVCDTNSNRDKYWIDKHIEEELIKKLEYFSKFKVVITDRYHGTIFSLISSTPVIVIKTNDHKVSTGINWFKGIYDDFVFYADSLDEAYQLACTIAVHKELKGIKPYFENMYYDKLKAMFYGLEQ